MVDLEGKTLYEALGVTQDASQASCRALLPPSLHCQPPASRHRAGLCRRPPPPISVGLLQAEIRKAYHKLALRLHPDKNPGDEAAKDKFQTLQKVFAILSDPDK